MSEQFFHAGNFGTIHTAPIPVAYLHALHEHTAASSPDAQAFAHELFDAPLMAVLHQAHVTETPLRCVKLVNGFAIVTPSNKIVSVISDKRLCSPNPAAEAAPPPFITAMHQNVPSYFFSQVLPLAARLPLAAAFCTGR